MERHCRGVHGGANKHFCNACPNLHFFASPQSLRKHMKEHVIDGICGYCGKIYSGSYLMKHERKCKQNTDARRVEHTEEELEGIGFFSSDVAEAVAPDSPLFRPEPSGLTRSSRAAPKKKQLQYQMKDFVEWLKSPTALGRTTLIRSHSAYFSKFRTTLGKLAKFHNKEMDKLFYHLNRTDTCAKMFEPATLTKFTLWLQRADDGRELNLRTIYNYLHTLVVFFEWKVNACGQDRFSQILGSLNQVCKHLSLQKDKMSQSMPKKAARLAKLPTVPQFVKFMNEKLKPKADEVLQNEGMENTWEGYKALRNYILFALLFGGPPQRKQFLELLRISNATTHGKYYVFQVHQHKTSNKYGPIVFVMPPCYYKYLKVFMEAFEDERPLWCADHMFLNKKLSPDKYLTRHFQGLVHGEFGVNVTIRDCRSIFINYAKQFLDMTQMYELSRQMCHSFQMQQSEYRVDDSVERALSTLHMVNEVTGLMPMCNLDSDLFRDENENGGDDDTSMGSANEAPSNEAKQAAPARAESKRETNDEDDDDVESIDFGFGPPVVESSSEEIENEDDDLFGDLTDEQFTQFIDDYNATHDHHI